MNIEHPTSLVVLSRCFDVPRLLTRWSLLLLLLALPRPLAGLAQEPLDADIDYKSLVSQADLIYEAPVKRPVEGLPIGNGRMGSLVWTSPGAVHFQINRNDVFAVNRNHAGAQSGPNDYCGGCAGAVVELGGTPLQAGPAFQQRLSLFDAESHITGDAIRMRCFVASHADVLVLEIDDRRDEPQPIRVKLAMWRAPEVITGGHSARYQFRESNGDLAILQAFSEKDHHCESAVAIRMQNEQTKIQQADERICTMIAPAKRGKRLIFITSAALLDDDQTKETNDPAADSLAILQIIEQCSYDDLKKEHVLWWRRFWSRTFVRLSSDDGAAQAAQAWRYRHLYYMASSSRGKLPPKWNASLFATEGDKRQWGAQFWVWTTEMLHFPLPKADAIDLMDPYFDMYISQLPRAKKAARQRWGSRGAYFPETTAFDGPTVLPDDVAAEFQDVLLGRKKHTELSQQAQDLLRYDSHLRVVSFHPREGRYTWISHVASSGSELAAQAWWRYRYTGDKQWLRTHAYPLLKGTVEFYRGLVKKGEDSRYHISGTHAHEDFWGVKDSIMDLAAIRGTVPLAIRGAEILDIDSDLRGKWKELLDNLAPYPMGRDPQAQALSGGVLADDVWAAGHLGDVDGQHNPEDVWLNPVFPFEDWTLETRDAAVDKIVQKTLDLAPRHRTVLSGAGLSTAIRTPIAVVRAGRGEELPDLLARYYAAFSPLANGMSQFEGPTAPSIEHLGLLSTTLQDALVQSVSPRPGEPEIIRVFPAWPRQWQASFRLLVRGGFLVSASIRDGEIESVDIHSGRGEPCRLRNSWGRPCQISESDGDTQLLSGDILQFNTQPGRNYSVVPKHLK
ncbi:MAG: hypothetical protein CMJ64_21130 [Planctomycetaceae bacterium]|nr:hypothetical protein [Planctomycetaceae bacterium]